LFLIFRRDYNPESFQKALFVFKQHFGTSVDLDVNEKRGILKVYNEGLPTQLKYNQVVSMGKFMSNLVKIQKKRTESIRNQTYNWLIHAVCFGHRTLQKGVPPTFRKYCTLSIFST